MTNNATKLVKPTDPRSIFPAPPFDQQSPIELPGHLVEMSPSPDHGENSYRGSGKLQGLSALMTGGDSGIGRAVALCYARLVPCPQKK